MTSFCLLESWLIWEDGFWILTRRKERDFGDFESRCIGNLVLTHVVRCVFLFYWPEGRSEASSCPGIFSRTFWFTISHSQSHNFPPFLVLVFQQSLTYSIFVTDTEILPWSRIRDSQIPFGKIPLQITWRSLKDVRMRRQDSRVLSDSESTIFRACRAISSSYKMGKVFLGT